MLNINPTDPYESQVIARLLDFLDPRTPWHRALWTVGCVLAIRELLEASEATRESVLSQGNLDFLKQSLLSSINDPGLRDLNARKTLDNAFKSDFRFRNSEYIAVEHLLPNIEQNYLKRWADAVKVPAGKPKPERGGRLIASHLLDLGFSGRYLRQWIVKRVYHDVDMISLSQLIEELQALTLLPEPIFEILLPLIAAPGSREAMPAQWLPAREVSKWLWANGHKASGMVVTGGFLLSIRARDVWAAIDSAVDFAEGCATRCLIGTVGKFTTFGRVYVKNFGDSFPLHRETRGVQVRALARENKVYDLGGTTAVDNALELLSPLHDGPPAAAVSGGWAAIESLFTAPTEEKGIAAERLAVLAACSFPRAELTALAHVHISESDDALAQELAAFHDNHERVERLIRAIENGEPLLTTRESDKQALRRMQQLISDPHKVLTDVEQHIKSSLRRLYRQRNLVLHWGKTNGVCLRAALRTAAPLIGAGMDRVVHAWLVDKLPPLELAIRCRINIDLVGTTAGKAIHTLVG